MTFFNKNVNGRDEVERNVRKQQQSSKNRYIYIYA